MKELNAIKSIAEESRKRAEKNLEYSMDWLINDIANLQNRKENDVYRKASQLISILNSSLIRDIHVEFGKLEAATELAQIIQCQESQARESI